MPERNILTRYNRGKGEFAIISVYWSIDFYNKIRMLAHRLRISASMLIFLLLYIKSEKSVINSTYSYHFDSLAESQVFQEIIKTYMTDIRSRSP